MSELQADDSGITYDGPEEQEAPTESLATAEPTEPAPTGSELAPDSPVEGEQNTSQASVDGVSVEGPEGFKTAINKQHFKFREEQRRAESLQRELDEIKAKQQPASTDVSIPPIPDSWDENYEEKIRQRDAAIVQKANADQNVQRHADTQAQQQRDQERQELERLQNLQNGFNENSKKLGVNQESMIKAQETVIQYGITPELANTLLGDSDGPLMVQYLATNPLDLHDIVNASPLDAGFKLAQVKTKAAALRPKTTSAPDPATTIGGRGTPAQERGPRGATFE